MKMLYIFLKIHVEHFLVQATPLEIHERSICIAYQTKKGEQRGKKIKWDIDKKKEIKYRKRWRGGEAQNKGGF